MFFMRAHPVERAVMQRVVASDPEDVTLRSVAIVAPMPRGQKKVPEKGARDNFPPSQRIVNANRWPWVCLDSPSLP